MLSKHIFSSNRHSMCYVLADNFTEMCNKIFKDEKKG